MKALLLADFYQAKKYSRNLLLVMAVFAVITVVINRSEGLNLFFPVYAMLMSSLVSMNLLAYDEQSKWNIYAQTMPFTRRQQVTVKYLDTLICAAAMWLVFTIVFAVMAVVRHGSLADVLVLSAVLPAMGLLPAAVLLPVVFRYGVTKGRIVYFIVIIVIAGTGGAIGAMAEDVTSLPALPAMPGWLMAVLPMVISAALYALSWALAIRWYEKREL